MYGLGSIGKVVVGTVLGSFLAVFVQQQAQFQGQVLAPLPEEEFKRIYDELPDPLMIETAQVVTRVDDVFNQCTFSVRKTKNADFDYPGSDAEYEVLFDSSFCEENVETQQFGGVKLTRLCSCSMDQIQQCRSHRHYPVWEEKYNAELDADPGTHCCVGNILWALQSIQDSAPCKGPAESLAGGASPACWQALVNEIQNKPRVEMVGDWLENFCGITSDHPTLKDKILPATTGGPSGLVTCSDCEDSYNQIFQGIPSSSSESSEASSSSSSEPSIYKVKMEIKKDFVRTANGSIDPDLTGIVGYRGPTKLSYRRNWEADSYSETSVYPAVIHFDTDNSHSKARTATFEISVSNTSTVPGDNIVNGTDFEVVDYISAKDFGEIGEEYNLALRMLSGDCSTEHHRLSHYPSHKITCKPFTVEPGKTWTFRYELTMVPPRDYCVNADEVHKITHWNIFSAKILRETGGETPRDQVKALTFLCQDAEVFDIGVKKEWWDKSVPKDTVREFKHDEVIQYKLSFAYVQGSWKRETYADIQRNDLLYFSDYMSETLKDHYELTFTDDKGVAIPSCPSTGAITKVCKDSSSIRFIFPPGGVKTYSRSNPYVIKVTATPPSDPEDVKKYCGNGSFTFNNRITLSGRASQQDINSLNDESEISGKMICPTPPRTDFDLAVDLKWEDGNNDSPRMVYDGERVTFMAKAWKEEGSEAVPTLLRVDYRNDVKSKVHIVEDSTTFYLKNIDDPLPECTSGPITGVACVKNPEPGVFAIYINNGSSYKDDYTSDSPFVFYISYQIAKKSNETPCGKDYKNSLALHSDSLSGDTEGFNNEAILTANVSCDPRLDLELTKTGDRKDTMHNADWDMPQDHINQGESISYTVKIRNKGKKDVTPSEMTFLDRIYLEKFEEGENDLPVTITSAKVGSKDITSTCRIKDGGASTVDDIIIVKEIQCDPFGLKKNEVFEIKYDVGTTEKTQCSKKKGYDQNYINWAIVNGVDGQMQYQTKRGVRVLCLPPDVTVSKSIVTDESDVQETSDNGHPVISGNGKVRFKITVKNNGSKDVTHEDLSIQDRLVEFENETRKFPVTVSDLSEECKKNGEQAIRCDGEFKISPGKTKDFYYTVHVRGLGNAKKLNESCKKKWYQNEVQAFQASETDFSKAIDSDEKSFAVACLEPINISIDKYVDESKSDDIVGYSSDGVPRIQPGGKISFVLKVTNNSQTDTYSDEDFLILDELQRIRHGIGGGDKSINPEQYEIKGLRATSTTEDGVIPSCELDEKKNLVCSKFSMTPGRTLEIHYDLDTSEEMFCNQIDRYRADRYNNYIKAGLSSGASRKMIDRGSLVDKMWKKTPFIVLCEDYPQFDIGMSKTWPDGSTDMKSFTIGDTVKFKISVWMESGKAKKDFTIYDIIPSVFGNVEYNTISWHDGVRVTDNRGVVISDVDDTYGTVDKESGKAIALRIKHKDINSHSKERPMVFTIELKTFKVSQKSGYGKCDQTFSNEIYHNYKDLDSSNDTETLKGEVLCEGRSSSSSEGGSSSSEGMESDLAIRKSIRGSKGMFAIGEQFVYEIEVENESDSKIEQMRNGSKPGYVVTDALPLGLSAVVSDVVTLGVDDLTNDWTKGSYRFSDGNFQDHQCKFRRAGGLVGVACTIERDSLPPGQKWKLNIPVEVTAAAVCGTDQTVNKARLRVFVNYDEIGSADGVVAATELVKSSVRCADEPNLEVTKESEWTMANELTYTLTVTNKDSSGKPPLKMTRNNGRHRFVVADDLPVGLFPVLPGGSPLIFDRIEVTEATGWTEPVSYAKDTVCQFKKSWTDVNKQEETIVDQSITVVCFIEKEVMSPGDTWSVDIPTYASDHATCKEDGLLNKAWLYDYGLEYKGGVPSLIGESDEVKDTYDCNRSSFVVAKEARWAGKDQGVALTPETEFEWWITIEKAPATNLSDLFTSNEKYFIKDLNGDSDNWTLRDPADLRDTPVISIIPGDEGNERSGKYSPSLPSSSQYEIKDSATTDGLFADATMKEVTIVVRAVTTENCSKDGEDVYASNSAYVYEEDSDSPRGGTNALERIVCGQRGVARAIAASRGSPRLGFCCNPGEPLIQTVPPIPQSKQWGRCGVHTTPVTEDICKTVVDGEVRDGLSFFPIDPKPRQGYPDGYLEAQHAICMTACPLTR